MTDYLTTLAQQLKSLSLPSWMSKGEPVKLLNACRQYWERMAFWAQYPLRQFNALTCDEQILDLLAYERDISRMDGEPLSLYRKRVFYAMDNARDAGEIAGFISIFKRLGIGYVELEERQPDLDWDIITVNVSDSQLADNSDLMMNIIQMYGRTCRRYRFQVITVLPLVMRCGVINGEYQYFPASLPVAAPVARSQQSSTVFSARI